MKKLLIAGIILALLIVNLPYILSYLHNYKWIHLFENKNYTGALWYFDNSDIWIYNQANSFYKLGQYKKAISYYLAIKTSDPKLNYYIQHNLGNAYYKLGETFENKNPQTTIFYRKKAIQAYQKALSYGEKIASKTDIDQTKSNLQYVLNKLKKLQKQQNSQKNPQPNKQQNQSNNQSHKQQKQSNQQKQNNLNQSKSNQNSQANKSWKKNNQNSQSQNNKSATQKNKSQQNKSSQNNNKSWKQNPSQNNSNNNQQQQLYEYLQQYSQQLQQQQKYYMRYYNQKYQPKDPFNMLDPFNDDPFFQEFNQQQEKDW